MTRTEDSTVVLFDHSLDLHGGKTQKHMSPARTLAISVVEAVPSSTVIAYADAVEIVTLETLRSMIWSFRYGSNLAAGLVRARTELGGPGVVELVTYSAPSAIFLADGSEFFDPDDARGLIRSTTIATADACRAARVRVNVNQVGADAGDMPTLVADITGGAMTITDVCE